MTVLEPVTLEPSVLYTLHDRSIGNMSRVVPGSYWYCFHCLNVSPGEAVVETSLAIEGESGDTAWCPTCGIDSLLGDAEVLSVPHLSSLQVLIGMKQYWFDRGPREPSVSEDMSLRTLQHQAYANASRKGFWDSQYGVPPNIPQKLMLVVSELSEALEEYRDGTVDRRLFIYEKDGKPEGFGVELADAVIRIADLAEHLKIDLSEMCRVKMAYNSTRPRMHGGKKA